SWSPTSVQQNVDSPSGMTNLYVRLEGASGFRGAELDLLWNPAGDESTCAAHVCTVYKTSADCTYLNRGLASPAVGADDRGHLYVSWVNSAANTSCSAGNAVILQFVFDGCAGAAACLTLRSFRFVDPWYESQGVEIAGATATVNGG